MRGHWSTDSARPPLPLSDKLRKKQYLSDPGIPGVRSMGRECLKQTERSLVIQVIQVIQVLQVIQVIQVVQLIQVIQVIQVMKVI